MLKVHILDKGANMKLAIIFIISSLLLSGCKGKEESQKTDRITPKKLCQTVDLQSAQKLVGKKLHTDSNETHKFSYATTCLIENGYGYPYLTVALYYNNKNREAEFFAPPGNVFDTYNKKVANNTIAVITKEGKNTIEVLQKGIHNWVVAVTAMNLKALDICKAKRVD